VTDFFEKNKTCLKSRKACHLETGGRHLWAEPGMKRLSWARSIPTNEIQSPTNDMNAAPSLRQVTRTTIAAAIFTTVLNFAVAGDLGPAVDDFSEPNKNSLGIDRQFIDDTTSGGTTRTEYRVDGGVLSAKGEISPPRGQPGWASTVLLLDPQGLPQDASAYEGIRMVVRVTQGNLAVSANSSEVTNFDYHAAPISRQPDGEFHEVRIPFDQMKRAWSEQTPLNTETLTSLSLVAVDLQMGSFDYEIDEIGFYSAED
jgi:hypothetical protein